MNRETLLQLAEQYHTPLYIFDTDLFRERAELVKEAFGDRVNCCFSIKANPFLMRNMPECFSNYEVCSPGELTICEKTGIDMGKVIFSGVNKTLPDIRRAMKDGVGIFTAESLLHVDLIQECAREAGKIVPVLLRLTDGSQLGMDESVIFDIVDRREAYTNIQIVGLHYFTGTQKKKASLIEKELNRLDTFAKRLREEKGFAVEKLEYGTGLAVEYFGQNPEETEKALLLEVAPMIRSMGERYHLTIEMGRFFAAPCGFYITKVMDVKENQGYHYAICDGGINQLKYHGQVKGMQTPEITLLTGEREGEEPYTLCGSLCTPADVLATIQVKELKRGDLLAFHRTGAYSVMEGIAVFLSRGMPAVVLFSEKEGPVLVRDFITTDIWNTPVR
ncbi:MAG: hypothetical protein ACI4D7_08940 [Lachnospiraceae bacterium]